MRVDRARLAGLPPAARVEAERLLEELRGVRESNPLAFFDPHPKQQPFFEAKTPVVAAFAGNRFGKTTALTVRSLIELVDRDVLPERLRGFKRWDAPARGRIVNPSFQLLESVIIPAFRQWTPREQLVGGSFDKAFKGAPDRKLLFRNGSWVQFMTYEMDLDKFGGSALHFCCYDEPPPQDIREECMLRLTDYNGYEMFALTPLKANTGWIRREIYKKREHPDITVIRGSIHDNPVVSAEAKDRILASLGNDLWRQAREFGDFVDVGGLIYPEFERAVVDPPEPRRVRTLDVVVGIDPGIRNAAMIWGGFDRDNSCLVFHEELLQDRTPADYARTIRDVNERWGITNPLYVIDPAARSRAQVNAESVESALAREGIFCMHGQNQVEAGIQQVRTRLQHGRLKISSECRGLRDEADEYAAEDRPDGEFKPIKTHDHRLDALRYLVMARAWDPIVEAQAPRRALGFTPDYEPPWEPVRGSDGQDAPLGAIS